MGWKGTIRSIAATARRIEREQERQARQAQRERQRHHREYERTLKVLNKQREREQAQEEVQDNEELLRRLLGIHKSQIEPCDWESISASPPPMAPERYSTFETAAVDKLNSFTPSFFDRLLRRSGEKRSRLEQNVAEGQSRDEMEYQKQYSAYLQTHEKWAQEVELAKAILNRDLEAFKEALAELNPFAEIIEFGSSISFQVERPDLVELAMRVRGEDVIPKEHKKFLQSGKVSGKPIPKKEFLEIYQDYVWGSALRAVREVFAILPVEHVLVHASADLLDTGTGITEELAVLSLHVSRSSIGKLKWEHMDASDSLKNFTHVSGFRRGEGFHSIERLKFEVE
jgi:hypothetical protein